MRTAFILLLLVACKGPMMGNLDDVDWPDAGPTDAEDSGAVDDSTDASGFCMPASNRTDLYWYESGDGVSFGDASFLLEPVSVPHLFLDTETSTYIASFQIFSEPPLCDRMAYVSLDENGAVIGNPTLLAVDSKFVTGFDPTLLRVESELVLAYTVRPPGRAQPCVSLAVGNDIESLVGMDDFLWCSPDDSEAFMDPSALYIAPYLYLYTPSDASMVSGVPRSYFARVDPTTWTIADTGSIEGLGMFLLGSAIESGNKTCPYRFYGTYQNNVGIACSSDGMTYSQLELGVLSGADPGVARTPNGSYRLVLVQEPSP